MYFTKTQIFFVMIITSVLLPLSAIFGLALAKTDHINFFVYFSICIAVYLFLYILYKCNSWEFTFQKLRIIPFILVTLVIIIGLHRRGVSNNIYKYDCWIEIAGILLILFMGCCIYKIYKASRKPENVLKMEFPFRSGKYLITDGGDGYLSALMNYHYKSSTHNQHGTQDSMRYAVDIVINNKPFPGKGKLPYNLGNYVVIKNEDNYVIMGHMEKGSIVIKEGDYIHIGDEIGFIGNSGLTPRPHLHLQVSKFKIQSLIYGTS